MYISTQLEVSSFAIAIDKMKIFLFLSLVGAVVCTLTDKYALDNNQFAIDLIREFSKHHNGNFIYSGFLMEDILGLTSLGAKGKTAEQIRKVLYLPQEEDKLKELVKISRDEFSTGKHLVTLANEIFLAKGIEAEPTFVKTATELFKVGVRNVDFGKTKEAVKEMNSFVSEKTNGKITDLVKEEQISGSTRMALVNALHFKGVFEKPFKPEDTEKADFYLTENSTVKVDMMKLTDTITTYTSAKYKVTFVMIPYAGTEGRANLMVMFPHEVEGLDEAKDNVHIAAPDRIHKFQKEYATIYLPKFKIQSTLDLKPILKNLGMTELFSAPDLSGITKESLTVDSMTQKVVFNLDEQGTEAAAATAEISNSRSLLIGKPAPKVYRMDRPFYFGVLLDHAAILAGRLTNPLEVSEN